MDGFLDLGSNLRSYLDAVDGDTWDNFNAEPGPVSRRRLPIDSAFLQVRQSVCVAGPNWGSLQKVKRVLASLSNKPLPLESFHVKSASDVKDGSLLVPKIVLVAPHCAGRPVLDCEGDQGTLDTLYDEACEIGADILLVYMGLPRAIYRPVKNMVYHPRMADIVFPDQPVLQALAEDNCLVTLVSNQDFSDMQKNVMREWLEKPVGESHPVYQAADYLSSLEYSMSDADLWSEGDNKRACHTDSELSRQAEASEDHTIFDYQKYKKLKKVLKKKKQKERNEYKKMPTDKLPLVDNDYVNDNIELNMMMNRGLGGGRHGGYGSLQDNNWSNPLNV